MVWRDRRWLQGVMNLRRLNGVHGHDFASGTGGSGWSSCEGQNPTVEAAAIGKGCDRSWFLFCLALLQRRQAWMTTDSKLDRLALNREILLDPSEAGVNPSRASLELQRSLA